MSLLSRLMGDSNVVLVREKARSGRFPTFHTESDDSTYEVHTFPRIYRSITEIDHFTAEDESEYITAQVTTGSWFRWLTLFCVVLIAVGYTTGFDWLVTLSGIGAIILLGLPFVAVGDVLTAVLPESTADEIVRVESRTTKLVLPLILSVFLFTYNSSSAVLSLLVLSLLFYIYFTYNHTPARKTGRYRYLIPLIWFSPPLIVSQTIELVSIVQHQSAIVSYAVLSVLLFIYVALQYWFFWIGVGLYKRLQTSKTVSIRSQRTRLVLLFLQLFISILSLRVLLSTVGQVVSYFTVSQSQYQNDLHGTFARVEELFTAFPGSSRGWLLLYLTLFMFPVFVLIIMWLDSALSKYSRRKKITSQMEPIDTGTDFSTNVPVYESQLASPGAVTVPLWSHLRSIIIIDSRVADKSSSAQLEAIYHHERYHILNHHGWKIDLLQIIGPPLLGANSMLPYFFPKFSEYEADRFALKHTNRESLISALDQVKSLQQSSESRDSKAYNRITLRFLSKFDIPYMYKTNKTLLFDVVHFGSQSMFLDERKYQILNTTSDDEQD